ncbi:MAG: hypothetical protein AB1671_24675, partial [Thermodesulfobacteriota bacterium]
GPRGRAAPQPGLKVRTRARRTQIDSAETTRPREQVQVGVDEAGKDGSAVAGEQMRAGGDARANFSLTPDGEDMGPPHRQCIGRGTRRVEGQNATSVQQKIGSGRG